MGRASGSWPPTAAAVRDERPLTSAGDGLKDLRLEALRAVAWAPSDGLFEQEHLRGRARLAGSDLRFLVRDGATCTALPFEPAPDAGPELPPPSAGVSAPFTSSAGGLFWWCLLGGAAVVAVCGNMRVVRAGSGGSSGLTRAAAGLRIQLAQMSKPAARPPAALPSSCGRSSVCGAAMLTAPQRYATGWPPGHSSAGMLALWEGPAGAPVASGGSKAWQSRAAGARDTCNRR
jgi:hypothetical protein